MTTQTMSRVAGGIAIVAVLVVSGMVVWSVLRQSDPGQADQQAEGSRSGEMTRLGDLTGYVGRVDPDAHTIVVAANPLGADPVMLVVAGDAAVTVYGKQGALGDLSKDMPVRVFYEVRNEVKHVTSIQVIADSAHAAAPSATGGEASMTDASPPVEARAPAEARPQATPPPSPPAMKPSRPEPSSATISVAAPPAARPSRPPALAADAASGGPAPATPRPGEGDADDGSAAVDWLLKGSGR